MEYKTCPKCKQKKEIALFKGLTFSENKICIDCGKSKRSAENANSQSGKSNFMRFAMYGITDRDY